MLFEEAFYCFSCTKILIYSLTFSRTFGTAIELEEDILFKQDTREPRDHLEPSSDGCMHNHSVSQRTKYQHVPLSSSCHGYTTWPPVQVQSPAILKKCCNIWLFILNQTALVDSEANCKICGTVTLRWISLLFHRISHLI